MSELGRMSRYKYAIGIQVEAEDAFDHPVISEPINFLPSCHLP